MTDPVRVPPPIEALIRSVAGRTGDGTAQDADVRASTFARGLALGALVGAAIAGSTIWQRRHDRARRPAAIDGAPVSSDRLGPDESPVA